MKGVILAAGYGSRFLPGTKTVPKEMFPLIEVPTIHYIVQELVDAGIQDILIVSSRRKKSLEDYFDREVELEMAFLADGSERKLDLVRPPEANIFFLRQQNMAGTGDALLLLEPFTRDDPFVVAYPDDMLIRGPSLAGQLAAEYERTGKTILAGQEIPDGDISRYGVMDVEERDGVTLVKAMVEKPPLGTEPSRIVSFGRYLYTPAVFAALRDSRATFTGGGEFTQTEAINWMGARGEVAVKRFEGELADVGTPFGYLKATVEMGLLREEFRGDFLEYLRGVMRREGAA